MCLCVPTGSRAGAVDTNPAHAGLCGTRVQYSSAAPGPGNRGTPVCASGEEPPATSGFPGVQILFGKSLPAQSSQTRDSLGLRVPSSPWRTFYQGRFMQPYAAEKLGKMESCGSWMREAGRSGTHRSNPQDRHPASTLLGNTADSTRNALQ